MSDYTARADEILPALIRAESGGDPRAVSPKGAFGLGQTMPATARDPGYGVHPMRDNSPREQRRMARDYLAAMLRKYRGDDALALAAYNAGPGNVDKFGGIPPFKETRDYVGRVLGAVGIGSAHASERPEGGPGEGLRPAAGLPEGFVLDPEPETQMDAAALPEGFTLDPEMPDEAAQAQPEPSRPPGALAGTPLEAPGTLMEGMGNAFERQLVGAQQIGSDIARAVSGESGKPRSEYRRGLDELGRKLEAEAAQQGVIAKGGQMLLPLAESVLIPGLPEAAPVAGIGPRIAQSAARLPARAAMNALAGEGFAALEPADSYEQRQEHMRDAAIKGAAFGEVGHVAGKVAGGIANMMNPKASAARQLERQVETDFGGKFGGGSGGNGGGGGEIPPTAPKNPSNIPGVQYSVGMHGNSALMALEKAARVRNGDLFFDLDNANRVAIYKALKARSLDHDAAKQMVDDLNSKTASIREDAFRRAREHLDAPGIYTGPLEAYVDEIRTAPGLRVNSGAQSMADLATRAIHPPARGSAAKSADAADQPPLPAPAPRRDVDIEKDDVLTAIRKLGGIDRTDYDGHWITKGFSPHPQHGPVWRAPTKDGLPQGRGIEDMAARLKDHGYLSPEADANDLEQLLMDAARGVADDSLLWSSARSGYGNLDHGPESQHQELMTSLSDLIGAMNAKAQRGTPKKAETLPADPEDLYQLRKEIADMLSSNAVAPDAMTNAVKSNRRVAAKIIEAHDAGQNAASDGRFGDYLQAYKEGMAPIQSGRTLADVLEKFSAGRLIPGTEIPIITRGAFKKAIGPTGDAYTDLGMSGLSDKLLPEDRALAEDAARVLSDMENAQLGPKATQGSDSAANFSELLKQGLANIPHGEKAKVAVKLLDALGIRGNARNLDKALLDPEEFQKVLDIYHKRRTGSKSLAEYLNSLGDRLPMVVNAVSR